MVVMKFVCLKSGYGPTRQNKFGMYMKSNLGYFCASFNVVVVFAPSMLT